MRIFAYKVEILLSVSRISIAGSYAIKQKVASRASQRRRWQWSIHSFANYYEWKRSEQKEKRKRGRWTSEEEKKTRINRHKKAQYNANMNEPHKRTSNTNAAAHIVSLLVLYSLIKCKKKDREENLFLLFAWAQCSSDISHTHRDSFASRQAGQSISASSPHGVQSVHTKFSVFFFSIVVVVFLSFFFHFI